MARHTLPTQTRLDATGAGAVTFTARHPVRIWHARVKVTPAAGAATLTKRPRAVLYLNGEEFESTYSGANDQTATSYDLDASETIECRWTGGDPGALATLILRGIS